MHICDRNPKTFDLTLLESIGRDARKVLEISAYELPSSPSPYRIGSFDKAAHEASISRGFFAGTPLTLPPTHPYWLNISISSIWSIFLCLHDSTHDPFQASPLCLLYTLLNGLLFCIPHTHGIGLNEGSAYRRIHVLFGKALLNETSLNQNQVLGKGRMDGLRDNLANAVLSSVLPAFCQLEHRKQRRIFSCTASFSPFRNNCAHACKAHRDSISQHQILVFFPCQPINSRSIKAGGVSSTARHNLFYHKQG